MKSLWAQGYLAKDIAKELNFGENGTPYEKLKTYHVWFYRQKFNLRKRRKAPFEKGHRRYKHRPKELGLMSPEEFVQTLNQKIPGRTFHERRKRTYCIVHYWTPLRASEIYERSINDFEITNAKLTIHLLRKKKGHKPTDEDEPVSIPLAFPLVNEVVEWLEKGEWRSRFNPENRPWKIKKDAAWSYIREVFKGHYPHYFRFNWISDATDDPETTIRELVAKTKLTLPALLKYIVTDEKSEEAIDQRKLERLKASGMIKS
jgi:hypothetical protein